MFAWDNDQRIVFFDGTLREGGAERVISILTKEMAENDVPVEIVIYYDEEIFYSLHPMVKVTSVSKNTNSKCVLTNMLWLRKYLKCNAELVVSFLAPFNMVAIVASLGLRIPIIVADRSDPSVSPSNCWVRRLRNYLYRFADLVVLQTKKNESYFSNTVTNTKVISNPVDLGEMAGIALEKEHEKTIVSVGRLITAKNQMMLIDAFSRVHLAFPDYKLVIYGDGPEREKLEKHICELNLSDFVSLPGIAQNVNELMSNAELFVLSSNYEGMPNALIEAMCLGIPVISTKVSGATDLIQDGTNGLLVDCGDDEGLADAMMELLANETLRKHFAENGLVVNNKLNVNEITGQWIETIYNIIRTSKGID